MTKLLFIVLLIAQTSFEPPTEVIHAEGSVLRSDHDTSINNELPPPRRLPSAVPKPQSAFQVPTDSSNPNIANSAIATNAENNAFDANYQSELFSLSGDFAAGSPDFPFSASPAEQVETSRPLADYWTPWHRFHQLMHRPTFVTRWSDAMWKSVGRSDSVTCDYGIGHERVMFAPSVVDTATSTPNIGLRFQNDRGLRTPDRAGYYWGVAPEGPGFDSGVNALDTTLRMEIGNKRIMALTDFNLRSLDPEEAPNTTGIGDIMIGAKLLMLDGQKLQLASVFRTYLPTGVARRGLGTGHTSLEQGLVARCCLSDRSYVFGEVKYWTPIGGDPDYSGDVLSTGLAFSTIGLESDVFALLPTLEFRTLTFLFGGRSDIGGNRQRVDGQTVLECYPGARLVLGPEGDLGLWELNFAAGFTLADDSWFDQRVLFGLRWNY